ncbi:MAG: hypothetical protein WC509_06515 [Candidatus Izemoplasmatales bacterium]
MKNNYLFRFITKHRKLFAWILVCLVVMMLCIMAFFYSAIIRLNTIMRFANNGREVVWNNELNVSEDDFDELSFVTPVNTDTQYYINGGCKYTVNRLESGIITICGIANYEVLDYNYQTTIEQINNQRFIVCMQIIHWKWTVITVESIN